MKPLLIEEYMMLVVILLQQFARLVRGFICSSLQIESGGMRGG